MKPKHENKLINKNTNQNPSQCCKNQVSTSIHICCFISLELVIFRKPLTLYPFFCKPNFQSKHSHFRISKPEQIKTLPYTIKHPFPITFREILIVYHYPQSLFEIVNWHLSHSTFSHFRNLKPDQINTLPNAIKQPFPIAYREILTVITIPNHFLRL